MSQVQEELTWEDWQKERDEREERERVKRKALEKAFKVEIKTIHNHIELCPRTHKRGYTKIHMSVMMWTRLPYDYIVVKWIHHVPPSYGPCGYSVVKVLKVEDPYPGN